MDPIIKVWLSVGMVFSLLYFPFLWLIIKRRRKIDLTATKGYFPWILFSIYTLYLLFWGYGFTFPKSYHTYPDKPIFNFMVEKKYWFTQSKEKYVVDTLKAILVAQNSYRSDTGEYAGGEEAFNFLHEETPGGWAGYCGSQVIDVTCPFHQGGHVINIPNDEHWPFTVRPASYENSFSCMAIGNWDSDPNHDIWTVNDTGAIVHHASENFNIDLTGIYKNPPEFSLANTFKPLTIIFSDNIHSINLALAGILTILILFYEINFRKIR